MSLIDMISRLFTPLASVIDELHTSDEERDAVRIALVNAQNQALALTLDLEREKLAARASLIAAEIGGQSWLQRNWRPITMLSFLILVILDAFGLLVFRLSDEAWLLLQIGLGGYVVGRSAEKMLPAIRPAVYKEHSARGVHGVHHG
ncbi:3TM-type holin [Candidatus Puniceispirillum sp.]|uniref:3TM-type holin n=1 Tax=Candidatus Puniceispirillum sp. TaxID=2026719 RepID=UPI003F6995F7